MLNGMSSGQLRTNDGRQPLSSLSFTSFLVIAVLLFGSWLIIGETLDKVPRGEPTAVCRDSRGFDGIVKSTTCGYEQDFGWPFPAYNSFEENKLDVTVSNAKRLSRRVSTNQLVITALVAVVYLLGRRLYRNRAVTGSKS